MSGRRTLLRAMAGASLLALVWPARAELVIEVIPIGFRDVDELLPVLSPLVPSPGSIGGFQNQLVVRSTPQNIAEIRQVLASLDRAPVNLMVSVRQTVNEDVRRDLLAASGRLSSGDVSASVGAGAGATGSGVDLRIIGTRQGSDDRDVHSVRVLEGREAFISTGKSLPLGERRLIVGGGGVVVQDSVRYQEVNSGFYVRARLSGATVSVEVAPQRMKTSTTGGGAIDVQQASTVVSGRLGQWMEIGGVSTSSAGSGSGIAYSTASRSSSNRGIFLKVDRLP